MSVDLLLPRTELGPQKHLSMFVATHLQPYAPIIFCKLEMLLTGLKRTFNFVWFCIVHTYRSIFLQRPKVSVDLCMLQCSPMPPPILHAIICCFVLLLISISYEQKSVYTLFYIRTSFIRRSGSISRKIKKILKKVEAGFWKILRILRLKCVFAT